MSNDNSDVCVVCNSTGLNRSNVTEVKDSLKRKIENLVIIYAEKQLAVMC